MRNTLYILSTVLFNLINTASAQITFQKTYNILMASNCHSAKQTTDGGYIMTGVTIATSNGNIVLIKTDSTGETEWSKYFEFGYGDFVNQTLDGGYIVTGTTRRPFSADYEAFLIKTDDSGDTLWTRTYGSLQDVHGACVQPTKDGGYIISGCTYTGATVSNCDFYLVKTDSAGNLLWSKSFGGSGIDESSFVIQTDDGGFIAVGYTQSFGLGEAVYLVKTDSSGNALWTKTYGGSSGGSCVQQMSDGGYIISGVTSILGNGDTDILLIKTDSSGNLNWSKTYGGTGYEGGRFVHQTSDGGLIVSGTTSSFGVNEDIYVLKTDSAGNIDWSKAYEGDYNCAIQQTTDGGYVVSGNAPGSSGYIECILIKTDSLGNSGCNQINVLTTLVNNALMTTTSPTAIIDSSGIESPGSFTVNTGDSVTTICTSVGIETVSVKSQSFVKIFPIPSNGTFSILFNEPGRKRTIDILNLYGVPVLENEEFNELRKEIYLKNIPQGVYFLKVLDGEKCYCKKLIIE